MCVKGNCNKVRKQIGRKNRKYYIFEKTYFITKKEKQILQMFQNFKNIFF